MSPPATRPNKGVKATAAVSTVHATQRPTVKRWRTRNDEASRTRAMVVTRSMITGLSMSRERDMVRPQAARLRAGSARRLTADCRAGPSSHISSKLKARGSQSMTMVARLGGRADGFGT